MLQGIYFKSFTVLHGLTLGMDWDTLKAFPNREAMQKAPKLLPLTCLIGRPSTGKSSVFKALDFISNCLKHSVPEAASMVSSEGFEDVKTHGVDEPMAFSLIFHREKEDDWLNYRLELEPDNLGRPRLKKEKVLRGKFTDKGFVEDVLLDVTEGEGSVVSPNFGTSEVRMVDQKNTALQAYGRMLQYPELGFLYLQITRWFIADEPPVFKRMPARQPGGPHRHLNARFDNAMNVLDYFAETDHNKKPSTVNRILQKIPDVKLTGDFQLDRELESGNLKLFLYYLLLEDNRPLICLDEPERGLFYERVEELITEIRIYLDTEPDTQVFISSHSTVLLDCLTPAEVWLLHRAPGETEGPVKARPLSDEPLVEKMSEEGLTLGTLWYSGHLDFL